MLPNHYHVLVRIGEIEAFSRDLGRLHGRTSYEMNKTDQTKGRKVWFCSHDRIIRSMRHYRATLNYIHNNPVKHGYAKKWEDWPYSSVHWYMQAHGRDWLLDLWRKYPINDYGDKWDP